MKKIVMFLMLAALFCTACRYEEGPGISFVAPEERIIANWMVDRVYKNGELVTESDRIANRPGNLYKIYYQRILDVYTFYNDEIRNSNYGDWGFEDNYKKLVMNFKIVNQRYYYVARIKRLTQHELYYEYDDEYGNHWRMELICNSRRNY